jgi:DNA mismatch repair protein MutS2
MELSADVAAHSADIVSDYEILAELDLIFAKAKLSYALGAIEPEVTDELRVKLGKARHPLLEKKEAVPIDIRIGGEFDTLVITGPNTGGKTVALKTLGLLCAMAQCGLHIPAAEGSLVPVFEGVLADIGDEQSIEQSLSTFSSHMTNIVGILDVCGMGFLLLLDELGAGTDPVEGAALAMAIIEHARKKGALIAATTHYAELKTYAVTAPGVANASCEFDVESLRPTYRLITGVPGKSNAFAISQRLGLPEVVIEDAKSRVNTENAAFEDALAGLESARIALEGERLEASRLLRETSDMHQRTEEHLSRIDSEREKAADAAKREAARILDDSRRTAESVMAELRDMQRRAAGGVDFQKLNEEKANLLRRLNEAEASIAENTMDEEDAPPGRALVPGDKVRLRGLGTLADVISVSQEGVLSLQAGIMKITARQDEVSLVQEGEQPEVKRQLAKSEAQLREIVAKPEVDLRGMLTDEAIPVLERFIDSARMAKLNSVVVIHGKGTGALRQAVHQCLRREQRGIKSFRLGRYGEGEDGVTIVEL